MQSSRPSRVSGAPLSAHERGVLIEEWGSVANAVEEAERREPEVFDRLWDSWDEWPTTTWWDNPRLAPQAAYASHSKPEFWERYWELALAALRLSAADEPDDADELLGGHPYAKADYIAAGKLHKAGKMTVTGIERRGLKRKRAYRIYRQFRGGAVLYDETGLRPGPGYGWDQAALDNDPPRFKLIRR
jgi:hypothetical protein